MDSSSSSKGNSPVAPSRSRSPDRQLARLARFRSASPTKFAGLKAWNDRRVGYDFDAAEWAPSPSPVSFQTPAKSRTLAVSPQHKSLRKFAPSPIDTIHPTRYRIYPETPQSAQGLGISRNERPAQAVQTFPFRNTAQNHDASSVYSQDLEGTVHISPLRLNKQKDDYSTLKVLKDYRDWKQEGKVSNTTAMNPQMVYVNRSINSEKPGIEQVPVTLFTSKQASLSREMSSSDNEPDFTPFGQLVERDEFARRARKVMIGENGWLERTSRPDEDEEKISPTRKPGFIDNLVKRTKKMMVDSREQRHIRKSPDRTQSSRTLPVSLSPREQAVLYCEFEFLLSSALDVYINVEFQAGRLGTDKLKRVSEAWQHAGHPKVIGFRYDVEFQLELIRLHTSEFKFHGGTVGVPVITGILDMMKVDARAMRIRTFCQPDTVIAKQLLDAQNLFNLIGCEEHQQIKLAEVASFFRAATEKARVLAEREPTVVSFF